MSSKPEIIRFYEERCLMQNGLRDTHNIKWLAHCLEIWKASACFCGGSLNPAFSILDPSVLYSFLFRFLLIHADKINHIWLFQVLGFSEQTFAEAYGLQPTIDEQRILASEHQTVSVCILQSLPMVASLLPMTLIERCKKSCRLDGKGFACCNELQTYNCNAIPGGASLQMTHKLHYAPQM